MRKYLILFLVTGVTLGCLGFPGWAINADATNLDCTVAVPLSSGVTYSGTTVGSANNVKFYSCIGWDESGPEVVHKITTTTTGDLIAKLVSEAGVDLDVFILSSSCDENACLDYGDTEATILSAAPGTYHIVVDGYFNGTIVAEGKYDLTVTGQCEGVICDDGDLCTKDTCNPGTGNCQYDPICPVVNNISPSQGNIGSSITISGLRFSSSIPPVVTFKNGATGTVGSWSDTVIHAQVPAGAATGCVTVGNEYGRSECIEP